MVRWRGAPLAAIAAGAIAMALPLDGARAQVATATRAATRGAAEPVRLLVRPRVGDTLWLQVEQVIEMSGRRAGGERSPGALGNGGAPPGARGEEIGPRRSRAAVRVTRMQLFAHSLVEAADLAATTLLATTDSMSMWVGTAADAPRPQAMPLPAEGRQVRVRVTPDGAMAVKDPPPGATALGTTLSAIPGMLPDGVVAVGQRWERDIPMPSLPITGYHVEGVVHASFRLDSITHGGRDAWISLRGTLRRDGAAREMPPGTRVVTAGTIEGHLVVDRERAWMTDARTVMDVQSEVLQGPAVGAAAAAPVLLDLRLTQRVRVR